MIYDMDGLCCWKYPKKKKRKYDIEKKEIAMQYNFWILPLHHTRPDFRKSCKKITTDLKTNPIIEISLESDFWVFGLSLKGCKIIFIHLNFHLLLQIIHPRQHQVYQDYYHDLRKGWPSRERNVFPWMSHKPNSTCVFRMLSLSFIQIIQMLSLI